ncbi:pre-mRNA splicing regulator USH1G-like [Daphnia carinata]|uniref:pre-mRNA splicing regulator USH1G-like n=1 Tax=Daphnia carinata TaxID=120202 RepID=UPI00257E3A5D|nr:pre-mRNA splicing regulator USH1G-like [Daphnia carinata]
MAYRFHRAARDGKLDILKEATRKDCNTKDDDGMTPTLWAAFEGKLDALRLIVGRGGDPEKCDHYGNTALHFAAARGHMNCVTFLMNYGINLFAKDIDYHTATELAAMNDQQEILRYLDEQTARQQRADPKKVKAQIEKAKKETDKLVKDFAQVQEKARKLAEKEQKRLEKEKQKMERSGMSSTANSIEQPSTIIPRPSIAALDLRRDSRLIYTQSPKYSEIVNPKEKKDKIKLPVSIVSKKVQQQRRKMMNGSNQQSLSKSTSLTALNNNNSEMAGVAPGDFKIGAIEDGKRSVRSISGLRRDSEVMYVTTFDGTDSKRSELGGAFPGIETRSKSLSVGTNLRVPTTSDSGFGDDDKIPAYHQQQRGSIFDRPGIGRLAFRNSIAALVDSSTETGKSSVTVQKNGASNTDEVVRLNHNRRQREDDSDQDDLESDDDEEEDKTPLYFFLAAFGLEQFNEPLVKEKFDLDSLMLVTEADLISMKIPLGHRLKLMKAINDRKAAIESPDEMEDSHL